MYTLLDGVISCNNTSETQLVCCVGTRILILDLVPALSFRTYIPLPSCTEIDRIEFCEGCLFALQRNGEISIWQIDESVEWRPLLPRIKGIRDISVKKEGFFALVAGAIIARLSDSDVIGSKEYIAEVPIQTKHIRVVPPYLIAYGPSALWIGLVESNGIRLLYTSREYSLITSIWGHKGEILLTDHLAGLIRLVECEDDRLVIHTHDTNVLHPYAVAKDGNAWILITEHGPIQWVDGKITTLDLGTEQVLQLHTVKEGVLVIHPQRLTLRSNGRKLSTFELPGYNYSASISDELIACTTENGLYLFEMQLAGVFKLIATVSVPGLPVVTVLRNSIAYVATTHGLFTLDTSHLPSIRFLNQLDGEGDPVSLVVSPLGTYAYWGSGFTLRTIHIDSGGCLYLIAERRLSVYPHVLALAGDYLFVACGDGGLLWGPAIDLTKLKVEPKLPFASYVACHNEFVSVVNSKTLSLFLISADGSLSLIGKIDNQQDLSTCAILEKRIWFTTGNYLNIAVLSSTGNFDILSRKELPFAPRRLYVNEEYLLLIGSGGTLMVPIQ